MGPPPTTGSIVNNGFLTAHSSKETSHGAVSFCQQCLCTYGYLKMKKKFFFSPRLPFKAFILSTQVGLVFLGEGTLLQDLGLLLLYIAAMCA